MKPDMLPGAARPAAGSEEEGQEMASVTTSSKCRGLNCPLVHLSASLCVNSQSQDISGMMAVIVHWVPPPSSPMMPYVYPAIG